MISAGYKSAYQQGYSDAMRDFRKEPKTDAFDKIKWLIEQYQEEIEKCKADRLHMQISPTQAYLTAKIGVYGKVVADLKEMLEREGDDE